MQVKPALRASFRASGVWWKGKTVEEGKANKQDFVAARSARFSVALIRLWALALSFVAKLVIRWALFGTTPLSRPLLGKKGRFVDGESCRISPDLHDFFGPQFSHIPPLSFIFFPSFDLCRSPTRPEIYFGVGCLGEGAIGVGQEQDRGLRRCGRSGRQGRDRWKSRLAYWP